MNKLVTVCIPTYNSEETLSRTLQSLLEQSYPASKIKIFDNASVDKTRDVVESFLQQHPQLELHVNEVNLGGEGNFTKCIQGAEGDYTIVAHADDIYHKDFLKTSIQALESHPDAVATFCKAIEIDANERSCGERLYPKELDQEALSLIDQKRLLSLVFKYSNFITCPSVLVRSKIYKEKIKVWNGEKYKSSADLDVWFRLTYFGSLVAIREPLIQYRVSEASHSFRIAKKRITRHDLFLVLDYYRDMYQNIVTEADEQNYYFLNLKDQSIRSLNIVRNKLIDVPYPNDFEFKIDIVARRMFLSGWHFKMGWAVLLIELYLKLFKRKK